MPGTTYFYRATATNDTATVDGTPIEHFTTGPAAPIPRSGSAEDVTASTAVLAATVNPHGGETVYHFAYMTQVAYEEALAKNPTSPFALAKSTAEGEPLPAGNNPVTVTLQARELTPGTTYEFVLLASNPAGSETGPPATFTTQPGEPPPTTVLLPAAPAGPSAPALPAAFAVLAYPSIAELDAREAKEDQGIRNPPTPLTNAQKLKKALKSCKKRKNKHKRASCEKQARKKYRK